MEQNRKKTVRRQKTIFRALFLPMILVMLVQAATVYLMAICGGVVRVLDQSAADSMHQRLTYRAGEVENVLAGRWTNLTLCASRLDALYDAYTHKHGNAPFVGDEAAQVAFLGDAADTLIATLRQNQVNGVFLILNDSLTRQTLPPNETAEKYGLCIRDLDAASAYSDRNDLLLIRAPSAFIENSGCSLDASWEARYTLDRGDHYYYAPLNAAWDSTDATSDSLAYFSDKYMLDQQVVSYSLPLLDDDGVPYAVLGIELTLSNLSMQLPSWELGQSSERSCYVLAVRQAGSAACSPIAANGVLYDRCFSMGEPIFCGGENAFGGFSLLTRGIHLYGNVTQLQIYDNNSPFEKNELVLLALAEENSLFSSGIRVRNSLLGVVLLSLVLGAVGIFLVSRRFTKPINDLAHRVRATQPSDGFQLDHVGIDEIDLLVDSIESLDRSVSADRARTEFFSRMSHDMRTPMNAIISFSSPELLEQADAARKDDYLRKIHTSGGYLLGLINEVLDMTRIESGQIELQREPVGELALWGGILPMVEELAAKKDVAFTYTLSGEPNLFLLADAQHLSQIAMNLLSNAVKFTPSGGTVTLQAALQGETASERYCITVRDTGIGMSRDFRKKLFVPFAREHESIDGSGLGLSIAHHLIQLMGGSIHCESRRGEGTVFKVELPLERCDAPAAAETVFSQQHTFTGKRFLVCEDHPINAQIARSLLERVDAVVDLAEDGQAGVAQFSASPVGGYDAVLMDIRMPVMDGLDAARAIRALDRPDAQTVPIVAMTANAFEGDRRDSRAAGMNAHLAKPIEPQTLYQTLSALLGDEGGR